MLAGHEERDHHACDLVFGDGGTVFVDAIHEVPEHVVGFSLGWVLAALADNVGVDLGHFLLSNVALAVLGERSPG